MKLSIDASFTEEYLPTPRHRVLRKREVKATFEGELAEVSKRQAPIALVQRGSCPNDRCGPGEEFGEQTTVYRWWNERLWTRIKLRRFVVTKEERYATPEDVLKYAHPGAWHMTKDERARALQEHLDQFLLIGGELYEAIGEPRFVVMTFGLGQNHGGTALMVDNGYNGNIHRDRYFRIDQRKVAVAEATRIAKARGDTKDIPIRPHAKFDIRIREAVKCQPQAEHGTGDPFLNKINAASESGAPPLAVALFGIGEAVRARD